MDAQAALKNIGFTEKEAAVYLALLENGQGTAYQIAKRSGLKKPTAYVILDILVEKGAAQKILKPKNAEYAAANPDGIFNEVRQRITQAEDILPQLRALARSDKKIVETTYYEGIAGVKEMYKNLLRETAGGSYIGFFAHEKDTPKVLKDYWPELNAEMAKQKITVRGVTTNDETTKKYFDAELLKPLFEVKSLEPKLYSSNISIEIYGDYTHILSHRYLQGILIRNPDIAGVLRQIFEIVWAAK